MAEQQSSVFGVDQEFIPTLAVGFQEDPVGQPGRSGGHGKDRQLRRNRAETLATRLAKWVAKTLPALGQFDRRKRGRGDADLLKRRLHGLLRAQPRLSGQAQFRNHLVGPGVDHLPSLAQGELDLSIEHVDAVQGLIERQEHGAAGVVMSHQTEAIHFRGGQGKQGPVGAQEVARDVFGKRGGRRGERVPFAEERLGQSEPVGCNPHPQAGGRWRCQEGRNGAMAPLDDRFGLIRAGPGLRFRRRGTAHVEIGQHEFSGGIAGLPVRAGLPPGGRPDDGCEQKNDPDGSQLGHEHLGLELRTFHSANGKL